MVNEQVLAILAEVRGTEPGPAEVRAAADRIATIGDSAVPALLEALAEEDEAVLAVAARALRPLASPAVTRQLLGLLRSPDLGDVAKALLLGVLEDAGMDIHDLSLVGSVVDLEGVLADGLAPGAPPPGGGDGARAPTRPEGAS
jgi:HEAT repeat protein